MSSLVIQTSFLGDVVLTTPLLAALAGRGPVDVVVRPAAAPLLANHPAVRDVIVFDKRGTDRGLIGWWRFAGELAQCIASGALFGLFFVSPPGRLVSSVADLCGNFKALAMVRPFFIEQLISRRDAVFALGQLLQDRFVVVTRFPARGQFDLRSQKLDYEFFRRFMAAVEINCRHQRFKYVGQKRGRHGGMGSHPFTQDEKFLHTQQLADFSAGLSAHDYRLDFCQIALQIVGVLTVKQFANHRA